MKENRKMRLVCVAALMALVLLAVCLYCGMPQIKTADTPRMHPEATVHFIDVGQADCTLLIADGHAMLVDAGNDADGDFVVRYLKAQGVQKLDYLIGTHPHEDHIGGMDTVIAHIPIETIIMPRKEANTQNFSDVLTAIADKGYRITEPKVGDTYALGSASFRIIAPVRDYADETNNWSVGLLYTYGTHRIVMCGDAETAAEQDIVASSGNLKADILKVNHHGSVTSSCDAFIAAVQPTYAVIFAEKGNDYGHPHREVLQKLEKQGIQIFRTDRHGSIVATLGEEIRWTTEATEGQREEHYVCNKKTKVYHLPTCESVKKMAEKNKTSYRGTKDAVEAMGYSPCGDCCP